jgi:hypothetical protein
MKGLPRRPRQLSARIILSARSIRNIAANNAKPFASRRSSSGCYQPQSLRRTLNMLFGDLKKERINRNRYRCRAVEIKQTTSSKVAIALKDDLVRKARLVRTVIC